MKPNYDHLFMFIFSFCFLTTFLTLVKGQCLAPEIPENSKLHIVRGAMDENRIVPKGTVIKFICNLGYYDATSGKSSKMMVCKERRWLKSPPKCRAIPCPAPPEIKNGHIMEKKTFYKHSDIVMYECDDGYGLAGNSVLVCDLSKNGQLTWLGETPHCKKIRHFDCIDPGAPKDGFRTGDCCEHGSTVSFFCFEGLELEGSSEITCFNGHWSDEIPKCTSDVCCPPPPELPNGKINGTERECIVPWEFVDATCDPGFAITDASYRTYCEEDGNWDQNFPSCQAPECSFPDIPQNGTIKDLESLINYTPIENGTVQDLESLVNQTSNETVTLRAIEEIITETKLPYRSEIHFKCNPGFRMIGSSFITCEAEGWTDSTPKCELIQCPEPVAPENGWRSGDSFDVGDKVTFGCSSGYHLLGSTRRTCLDNGGWSGELARCTSKDDYCPNPGTPLNGFKIGNRYQLGDQVEFQCSPGHFMIGSHIRFCQNNKDWNGTQPLCIAANDFETAKSLSTRFIQIVEDLYPEVVENVTDNRAKRIDLSFSGLRVIIFVFDTSKSVGKKHFDTSIEFAKALVKKVGIQHDRIRVGAISFSTDVNVAFHPMDYGTKEEVLDALDRIEYNDGGTAMVKALRTIRQDIIPLIAQAEDLKNTPKEFDIFLLTDGKPNMAGEPFEETNKLKEQNVKIHCIGITGSLDMEKLYQMASEPKDEYVFILSSYDVMQDLIADLTNGSVDYGHCGLRPRLPDHMAKPQGDDRQKMLLGAQVEKPWPWMVALYNTTGKDRKHKIFICGGSLINNRWVLTAAHCLTESKEGYRITVELGHTRSDNRTAVEEYEIQSIIMHENYDNDNFDNDIALLKLERMVAFSRYIRPVCLPPPLENIPPESNFYGPLEDSVATGWGYDKPKKEGEIIRNFRPTNVLKYGHIPIQSRPVCEDFVERERQARSKDEWHKYQFTDSMFCAGTGGDEPSVDTCRGDSGGPLMQSDLEGTQWTQVGVISWGFGCGQQNKYGFYAHVAYLRNWIDDKVRENSKDP